MKMATEMFAVTLEHKMLWLKLERQCLQKAKDNILNSSFTVTGLAGCWNLHRLRKECERN
jgi:hypothetical protein